MNKKGKLSQKASIGLALIFAGIAILAVEQKFLLLGLGFIAVGIYLVSRE
ncbi:hypothetical protein J4404_00220 [Candidatus Woesearchaeota archaeon]|nr:hypothetical protein [Candidatus Woesearchaeota archaeon]